MPTKAIEAQRQLLAALFENPEIYPQLKKLTEEDFEDGVKPYRRTWAAIKQDITAGKAPTEASVAQKTGLPLETITSMRQIEYDLSHIEYYLEVIIEASKQRYLQSIKTSSTLEEAEKAIEIAKEHGLRLPSMDKRAVEAHIDQYIADAEVEREIPLEKRVITTPFSDLNGMIGGFFNGDFVCIAARPGMGKTAALGCTIEHVLQQGFPVASFILEMTPRRIIERFAARHLDIEVKEIIMLTLDDAQQARLYQYLAKLKTYPWTIYSLKDGIGTFSRFRDTFLGLYQDRPFRMATVDYLQLMHYEGAGNRTQEIGHIANGLAGLATEVNIPIVAASQLSRAVETRQDKRPILSDLRESGDIEQAAATVCFLYREGYYDPHTPTPDVAEIGVPKSRYGPTGSVEVYWNGRRMMFADLHKSTVY